MIKLFIVIFTIIIQGFAGAIITIPCSQELQPYLEVLQKLPEARALMAKIQQEGEVRILMDNSPLSRQFGAFWDVEQRVICINPSAHRTQGEIIKSILFEMQNASANSQLRKLDELVFAGKIDRESFVTAVEKLEWENSCHAAKMANKGIRLGLYPPTTRLHVYRTFGEYYRIQKRVGHSAQIGRSYDQMAAF